MEITNLSCVQLFRDTEKMLRWNICRSGSGSTPSTGTCSRPRASIRAESSCDSSPSPESRLRQRQHAKTSSIPKSRGPRASWNYTWKYKRLTKTKGQGRKTQLHKKGWITEARSNWGLCQCRFYYLFICVATKSSSLITHFHFVAD